jgi:predicted Fe-S protein YdhL (DUF1289 family)
VERQRAAGDPREGPAGQRGVEGRRAGKLIWGDARLHEELAYCVPLGIPHSRFLSWSDDDQDKALAWQREQRKVCRGCGTRKEEWDRDKFAYVGETTYCPGCDLLAQEQENLQEMEERGQKGVGVRLVPRELAADSDEMR